MKQTVEQLLTTALGNIRQSAGIPDDFVVEIKLERTKDGTHGDFATNLALILAKPCRQSPRQIASLLIDAIPQHPDLEKVEIAGPGFINFFLRKNVLTQVIATVFNKGKDYGRSDLGQQQQLLLEFVSANPTGPLHVGHGRSAAFGATLANLLSFAGYKVTREYYVNDAGRQMDILAVSVWLRYLALLGEPIIFPANGYRGDYVNTIAQSGVEQYANSCQHPWAHVIENLPADEPNGGDKEIYIDAIILRAKSLLGESNFRLFHQLALNTVLNDIKDDLAGFGVEYDDWFSEHGLLSQGAIAKSTEALKKTGQTYIENGALWFKATAFGDEKDRVLIRANGQNTYFAADVAYHWNKYERGFDRVIDIFGADHHGYISRLKSAVRALGHDDNALNILLVQFAILYRGGERLQMSTRSGSFVTLRELRDEVGTDAARFFYVMRKPEQHMDFDLDLAKSQSNDNPVYYIQYAHARICSVLRQLKERGLTWDEASGLTNTHLLTEASEQNVLSLISRFPETIEAAARTCEPHQIAYYLRELATGLHSYYNAVIILCEQDSIRSARLCLLVAVRQVLRNGLQLLGVSAPESM